MYSCSFLKHQLLFCIFCFCFVEKANSLLQTLLKIRLDCHIRNDSNPPRVLTVEERFRLIEWCSCEIVCLNILNSRELMAEYVYCVYRAIDDAYVSEVSAVNSEA